jgi:hypothetical protein
LLEYDNADANGAGKRVPLRKLFVSHSAKPENLALLKDLCHALGKGGAGFHVLVDQGGEIPAGADWGS